MKWFCLVLFLSGCADLTLSKDNVKQWTDIATTAAELIPEECDPEEEECNGDN